MGNNNDAVELFEDPTELSNRGMAWLEFSNDVLDHIENYTVPQYGDSPDDQVSAWTAGDCIKQVWKYTMRFNKNQRGQDDQMRDMLKIAHYASIALEKLKKDTANDTANERHTDLL